MEARGHFAGRALVGAGCAFLLGAVLDAGVAWAAASTASVKGKRKEAPAPAPPRGAGAGSPSPGPASPAPPSPAPGGSGHHHWGARRGFHRGPAVVVWPAGPGAPLVVQDEGGSVPSGDPGEGPDLVEGGGSASVMLDVGQSVALLGDPLYSREGKLELEREILRAGIRSIPLLVAQLEDKRSFERRPSGGPGGALAEVTVAQECEDLLYEIITPRYRSPHQKGVVPRDATVFTVVDWKRWWARRQGMSLAEVRKETRLVMDRYWLAGGVEQRVE